MCSNNVQQAVPSPCVIHFVSCRSFELFLHSSAAISYAKCVRPCLILLFSYAIALIYALSTSLQHILNIIITHYVILFGCRSSTLASYSVFSALCYRVISPRGILYSRGVPSTLRDNALRIFLTAVPSLLLCHDPLQLFPHCYLQYPFGLITHLFVGFTTPPTTLYRMASRTTFAKSSRSYFDVR